MRSQLLSTLSSDPTRLPGVLADEVVFHSPVTDYRGVPDVAHILSTIAAVVDTIGAHHELDGPAESVAFLDVRHHDRRMTGTLHERYDPDGRVVEATLLLRPLSVLRTAITEMGAALERDPLPIPPGRA